MHAFTIICCFSRLVRSNGQVGLGKVDKHCMLVWYRHVCLSILHFCIGFCIFLHRASSFFGTSFGPGRSGIPLYMVAPTHFSQSVLDYHGSKQSIL